MEKMVQSGSQDSQRRDFENEGVKFFYTMGTFTAEYVHALMENVATPMEDDKYLRAVNNTKTGRQPEGVMRLLTRNGWECVYQKLGEMLRRSPDKENSEYSGVEYCSWKSTHNRKSKVIQMYMDEYGHGNFVETGDIAHPCIQKFMASPFGLTMNADGKGAMRVVEVKYLLENFYAACLWEVTETESLKRVEPRLYWQMVADMSCTGASGGDLVFYNSSSVIPIHVVHVERIEQDIMALEERVSAAVDWVKDASRHLVLTRTKGLLTKYEGSLKNIGIDTEATKEVIDRGLDNDKFNAQGDEE